MADTEGKRPNDAHRADPAGGGGGYASGEIDRDVNIRAVVWTGAILAGVTALSIVLMWFFFKGLEQYKESQDPQPSPLQEARQPNPPPGPRLQSTPEEDLATMRHQEDVLLHSYSLIEGEQGYARIPVDDALDLALEEGLGTDSGRPPEGESVASRGALGYSPEQPESPSESP